MAVSNNSSIYEFLFHPLSKNHTPSKKIWASITLIALSILTGFAFLIAFSVINIRDNEKAKKIAKTSNTNSTTTQGVANPVLSSKSSPPSPNPNLLQPPTSSLPNADMAKVATVKRKQKEQLDQFEKWAQKGQWDMFHHQNSHYDWWMFPIDKKSNGQGWTYTVLKPEIEVLKNDPEFMKNYLRGAELVAKSWGWEIKTGTPVQNPTPSQHWENWPVRLGKMADSFNLFGQDTYREHMKQFALAKLDCNTLEIWVRKALKL